jgi:hypothetical protein
MGESYDGRDEIHFEKCIILTLLISCFPIVCMCMAALGRAMGLLSEKCVLDLHKLP